MAGRVCVGVLAARYMATWRGQATRAVRLVGEQLLARDPEGLAGEVLDALDVGGPARAPARGARVEAGEDLVGERGVERRGR